MLSRIDLTHCTKSVRVLRKLSLKLRLQISIGQGVGVELLFTFILVFFIFSVTDEKKKTEPYGTTLGIGVCVLVAHVCIVSESFLKISKVTFYK